MPSVTTRHFGPLDYQQDAVLEFPAGLPGFEQETRFLPVEHPAARPIVFLQSLRRPELCFLTLPVLSVEPQYRLALSAEDLSALGFAAGRQPEIGAQALCLAIVSVMEERAPTANLLAPLVVNVETRRGLQAVQEDCPYSHQHPLFPQELASCS